LGSNPIELASPETHLFNKTVDKNLEGLGNGLARVNTLTCPKHRAKFDVTTGKVVSGPKIPFMHPKIKDEPTYVVKVDGKDIMLEPQ
jgi:nitrite reductase/ring-hydroxylating ferredoxin subunit